jgi:hypothetical protein
LGHKTTFVFLLLFMALFLIPASARGQTSVVFGLSPGSVFAPPGTEFNVTVGVTSGGAGVFFGTFDLAYNSTQLGFVSAAGAPGWTVTYSGPSPTAFRYTQSAAGCGGACPPAYGIAVVTFRTVPAFSGNSSVSLTGATASAATGGPLPASISRTQFLTSVSYSAPPVFGIAPASVTLQPSQAFNATISVLGNGAAIATGTFTISFNSSDVQPTGYASAPGWKVTQLTGVSYSFSRLPATAIAAPPSTGPVAVLTFTPTRPQNLTSLIPLSAVTAQDSAGDQLSPAVSPDEPSVTIRMTAFVPPSSTSIASSSSTALLPPAASLPWQYIIPAGALLVGVPVIAYVLTRSSSRKKKRHEGPDFTTEVLRKDDLLSMTVDMYNFKLQTTTPPGKLVRIYPAAPAYMAVTFQGQNINERAFFEQAKNVQDPQKDPLDSPTLPPVPAILAGPSRIAFQIPDDVLEIPYTFEGILAWTGFQMNVVPAAQPASVTQMWKGALPPIRQPGAIETSVEAPYRLMVSPSAAGGWAHSLVPVTHDGWTELWHTRLGVRKALRYGVTVDELDPSERAIRAVWSPDYTTGTPPNPNDKGPFRSSLSPRDRHELVRLTSDFSINASNDPIIAKPGGLRAPGSIQELSQSVSQQAALQTRSVTGLDPSVTPQGQHTGKGKVVLEPIREEGPPQPAPGAVAVNRLMLTTLGAWMDVKGTWFPPPDLTVQEWVHQATMGRDSYVKVVYKGFLFPFGHGASLVKVTERKFVPSVSSGIGSAGLPTFIAYLRQHMYIVVHEHEKSYSASGRNNQGRDWPFTQVEVTTQVTPDIDDPGSNGATVKIGSKQQNLGIEAFWPRVGSVDFAFHAIAKDLDGKTLEFQTPLMFVMSDVAIKDEVMSALAAYYSTLDTDRTTDFTGQKVAFAESSNPGDTAFETQQVLFGAEVPRTAPGYGLPHFYPTIWQAGVNVTALSTMLGMDAPMPINYDDTFLAEGIYSQNNQGEVFAKLAEGGQLALDFPADKVGGLVNPNMSIVGLSRSLGPVGGDLASIKAGTFDPNAFFKGALTDAKILGVSLMDIVAKAVLGQAPKFVTQVVNQSQQVQVPKQVVATLNWQPTMKDDPAGIFIAHLVKDKAQPSQTQGATMLVTATITKNLDGTPPTAAVHGELKNFEIHLIPAVEEFLVVKFNGVTFDSQSGKKLVFNADLYDIQFAGPLAFVNILEQYIPLAGFDRPSLLVTPEGVQAGFDLAIPSIGFGIFSLQNISLGASLNLPFTGDPVRVRFNFSERQNPFLLSVSLFGGGGFFGLSLGPDKVEMLEASLEFGGNVSLDLGVASGGIYVMAGIYFKLETVSNGEDCELTGYLRCGGSLEVLGMITISAQFYMGLTYDSNPKRVWGQASLTVEVSVAFFSQSVTLTVQREFASSPPPTFEDLVPDLQDWSGYCEAFA